MTLDVKARSTASRLIAKFGKSVTHTSITTGTYDPATGSSSLTSAAASVRAVVEDYSLQASGAAFQSGLIISGDKKITMAAQGAVKPKPGDTFTVDGVVYAIVRVTETWSGELVALYECQGRI